MRMRATQGLLLVMTLGVVLLAAAIDAQNATTSQSGSNRPLNPRRNRNRTVRNRRARLMATGKPTEQSSMAITFYNGGEDNGQQ
jgi:hypothetical protein